MKNIFILFTLMAMLVLITGCFENGDKEMEKSESLLKRSGGESNIKIYYSREGLGHRIHYSIDGMDWTEVPGEEMVYISDDNPFNQYGGYYVKEFDAKMVEFVFTDEQGQNWDNNNGNNYLIDRSGTYMVENGKLQKVYEGVAFVEYEFENLNTNYEYVGYEVTLYKDGELFKTIKIGTFVNTSKMCNRITRLENGHYELELKIIKDNNTMYFASTNFDISDYEQSKNIMLTVKEYPIVKDKIVIYYLPKEIAWKHSPEGVNIHYNANNSNWTNLPGINVIAKSYKYSMGDRFSEIRAKYEINAQNLEFCFNYLGNEWDNNNTQNYIINKPGIYEVISGKRIRELPQNMIEQ